MTEVLARNGAVAAYHPTTADLDLIRRTVCKDLAEDEFRMFAAYCKRTQLDPLARQIYAMKYGGKVVIQTSIDGFRLIAERTGRYRGRVGPWWCGPDAAWVDVWLKDEPPLAAKVGVRTEGTDQPTLAVAKFREFAPRTREGALTEMWQKMPSHMLAKVAEAQALRAAFPHELSGMYTDDEMVQRQAVPTAGRVSAPTAEGHGRPVMLGPNYKAKWEEKIVARGGFLGVTADAFDPSWTKDEYVRRAREWEERFRAKEAELAKRDEQADGLFKEAAGEG